LDAESTTTHTLDYFVPEDNEANNSAVHKQIRQLLKEPIDTEDDKPLSREETVSVIKRTLILKGSWGAWTDK